MGIMPLRADTILRVTPIPFAQNNTITGSIGVFEYYLIFELTNKIGIHTQQVKHMKILP
jgi:hypothetical protein